MTLLMYTHSIAVIPSGILGPEESSVVFVRRDSDGIYSAQYNRCRKPSCHWGSSDPEYSKLPNDCCILTGDPELKAYCLKYSSRTENELHFARTNFTTDW